MRFHVLGLPHTVTSKEYVACAYTQKALKFCKMMRARGHYIIHYGHEDSVVDCDEHVTVVTNKDLEIAYGNHDWHNNFFKFDINDHAYQTFYTNGIREVASRKQKNDFILPFWGAGTKPVCDAHPDLITVEPGIGYAESHWARWRIYESHAMMNSVNGINGVQYCNMDWYHTVIPNYFDLDDFEYCEDKEDYFLYLGRIYKGKGVDIAVQMTEALGKKLILAGQGSLLEMGYQKTPDHVELVGYADTEKRKKLMSKAKALIIGSGYCEPFGGVQIEAMLSGTPVISPDWGAFAEYNIHGYTGYRCRTFADFVEAGKQVNKLNPKDCRIWGENFSLEKVAEMYEKYFQDVLNVYEGQGWYQFGNQNLNTQFFKLPSSDKTQATTKKQSDEYDFEKDYWGDCTNTFGEDRKHYTYARLMGLRENWVYFEGDNKRIIDIGGGPTSMLLKCLNLKEGLVVDPIDYPEWTKMRYKEKNIRVHVKPGEMCDEQGWDEVWIYNCLQHTIDPQLIINNAKKAAKTLRIFEWIDIPAHEGHPWMLTEELLDQWIGDKGSVVELNENGCFGKAYYGTFTFE